MTQSSSIQRKQDPQSLGGMQAALQEMLKEPHTPGNAYRQAVLESCPIIDELLAKGHTYRQISDFLKNAHVKISENTLKKHHLAIKKQSGPKRKARHRQSEEAQRKPGSRTSTPKPSAQTAQTAQKLSLADYVIDEQDPKTDNPAAATPPPTQERQEQPPEQTKTFADYLKGAEVKPDDTPPPPPLVQAEILED